VLLTEPRRRFSGNVNVHDIVLDVRVSMNPNVPGPLGDGDVVSGTREAQEQHALWAIKIWFAHYAAQII
jgi:hypothetical protein